MSAEDMRKVVGLADGCELMSALTRFPDNDVAAAVVNGSVTTRSAARKIGGSA
ncbi:MAG: hypothetical protein ACLSGS_08140 [Adlercreutzia sp.]